MTIAQPIIDVEDVTFSYGNAPVLERVNLQVHDGEFLGIVGPNAGGKSTLLKIILGLLQPQSGRTRVLGRRPRLACRMIGYVPQHPSFPRDFPITVEQVVLLGRLGVKQSGDWLGAIRPSFLHGMDREAARRALCEVEADDLADRQIASLSGGQQQRVAIARALAHKPSLVFADEPTGNLDRRIGKQVFDVMLELKRELGTSLVVVTHDELIAARMERVLSLVDGRLSAEPVQA